MKSILGIIMLSGLSVCLQAGARFNNNGDGTVTDNGTRLIWQRCSYGQDVKDCSGAASTATWTWALRTCRNLSMAGRNWRLPSVNELRSIVDYSASDPAINIRIFPKTVSDGYWTSSTNVSTTANAWGINFSSGGVVNTFTKSGTAYVRCVADGP